MGADKLSINSPALMDPELINEMVDEFGQQCVVIGIDSYFNADSGEYEVHQFTGDESKSRRSQWQTKDWVNEVIARGAGEIVLNCMNQDGVRKSYDVEQRVIRRLVLLLIHPVAQALSILPMFSSRRMLMAP